ncbi:CidA/LrgA family protein [Enterococcus massiliensis]|uniref:CidA/LrgA family protein n=1 Tax=Enterococcus massiliensis TaxID=1640685 RepID=UPI00065E9B39|nr:CidA/LrgA family protein [Enterococcus massiliensis]
MKLGTQLAILLAFSILGEGVRLILDLPIPGSILGILLLFLAFENKIVDAKKIEPICDFFLDNLTIFFVPAGVRLMDFYGVIKDTWPILLGITTLCVIVILMIIGKTAEFVEKIQIRRR